MLLLLVGRGLAAAGAAAFGGGRACGPAFAAAAATLALAAASPLPPSGAAAATTGPAIVWLVAFEGDAEGLGVLGLVAVVFGPAAAVGAASLGILGELLP